MVLRGRRAGGVGVATKRAEADRQARVLGDDLRRAMQSDFVRLVTLWNLNFDGPPTGPNAPSALVRPNWTSLAVDAIAQERRARSSRSDRGQGQKRIFWMHYQVIESQQRFGEGFDMAWRLASSDHAAAVDLVAGDSGSLSGTLTVGDRTYPVSGGWSASGSITGRNYSAFSLSGRTQTQPDVPNWIAAAGIMTGPGAAPEKIDIQINETFSSDGTFRHYSGVLVPA